MKFFTSRYFLPNSWYDVVYPFHVPNKQNQQFIYDIDTGNNSCIDRIKAENQLSRYVGLIPAQIEEEKNEKMVLIVGATTVLGYALGAQLKKQNISYIPINGISDIDFSSVDSFNIFKNIPISKAFIFYQPSLSCYFLDEISDNTCDFSVALKYFKGLLSFLRYKNASFIYATPPPYISEISDFVIQSGGTVIDLPYFIDNKAIYDSGNPFIKVYRDCLESKHSEIILPNPQSPVISISANEICDNIYNYSLDELFLIHNNHYQLHIDETSFPIQNVIEKIAQHEKCSIEYKFLQFKESSSFKTLPFNFTRLNLEKSLNYLFETKIPEENPYLSIVVCGRHDNFSNSFETRAQNFINQLSYCKHKVPMANFEVIFVDYATPKGSKTLNKILEIPENLKGLFHFIIVPPETHLKLITKLNKSIPFLEYIAKNIGIRRSSGDFVLTTNPDDLLSPEFFQYIASHQLNEGVFYRAQRYNMGEIALQQASVSQYGKYLLDPKFLLKNFNISKRCRIQGKRFSLINSQESFRNNAFYCAAGDFIMLSRKMWEAIGGFNEYPGNPNVDAVFQGKMMRMIPGFYQNILHPIILHQRHPKRNVFRPCLENHETIINQYICHGKSELLNRYPDESNWGLEKQNFRIITL